MKWFQSLKKWLFFNREYLHHPRWETGITPPELIGYAQNHTPGKALEIGCGSGLDSLYLASMGWTVDAVDFSPLAIRKAQQRMRGSGLAVQFMIGDAARLENLPLRPPYDLILDIGCVHGLGDETAARAYAENVTSFLKPGGNYLLYAHSVDPSQAGYPSHGLNLVWVEHLFRSALNLLEYRPGEEEVHRGTNEPKRTSAWYFLAKPS